jgi:putative transposase
MPDHIHFFCAPASYPPSNFHRWMAYWKFLATREYWRMMRGALGGSQCSATLDARQRVPPTTDAQQRVPPVRNPPLFQRDCWDRQLRTGESYAQKWEYVRNNPVRKGLVAAADDWPYQGELNVLVWHERS